MMLLQRTTPCQTAAAGARACRSRPALPLRGPTGRRRCPPVCFKEGSSDSIDEKTAPPTTTAAEQHGVDPLQVTGLKPVAVGPLGTVMFPFLGGLTAAAAALAILAPSLTGKVVFNVASTTPTNNLLIMTAGASLIPTIISKRQLRRAAEGGTLGSPVHKQMATACLLHSVLGLVVLAQAVSLRNPVLAASVGGLCGVATITMAYTLMKVRESAQVTPSTRGSISAIAHILMPANLSSVAYAAICVTLLGLGAALVTSDPLAASPVYVAAKDSIHVFCSRIAGAGVLAAGILAYTLKEAADANRAGSRAFRGINVGIGMYGAVVGASLAYALWAGLARPAAATYMTTVALLAIASFCGYSTVAATA